MYPDELDPDVSVRERVYSSATSSREGRRSIAVALLTICVFVFIISLSCRQSTAPGPARNVLESGIVTLTDIDQMLADEGDSIREAASASESDNITIPGYPLDIVLTRSEITTSSNEELRGLILERSSALIYAEGISAFDRTGEQSLRRLSIQGLLELSLSQVSQSTHDRAGLIAMISLLGIGACGAIVAATGTGWGRMRSLGMAATAGAIPVVLMFVLLRLIVGQLGGDDPFVADYRDVTKAALGVPVRNGLVVFAAGVVVIAFSLILPRLEALLWPVRPAQTEIEPQLPE
ncbi:MAG: hypothetical protein AB7J35_14525 [Dehalococcoidia bacterium]